VFSHSSQGFHCIHYSVHLISLFPQCLRVHHTGSALLITVLMWSTLCTVSHCFALFGILNSFGISK
jgi:uncharacterized protein with PQ loop repeat